MAKGKGASIDAEVGKRVKALRLRAALSQEKVADHLGLTFQQVQKYEKGVNRIGPSRLLAMAKLFKVPVETFFPEEASAGKLVPIDTRLNTRVRHEIVDRLAELDNRDVDNLVLHGLDVFLKMAGRV
jgi:transcriptional regulator with XRE-family HTH domain